MTSSEVGYRRELVPLDGLFAQVKVLKAEGDSAQVTVLTQRLRTEHAQLQLPLAQRLFIEVTVHKLRIINTQIRIRARTQTRTCTQTDTDTKVTALL